MMVHVESSAITARSDLFRRQRPENSDDVHCGRLSGFGDSPAQLAGEFGQYLTLAAVEDHVFRECSTYLQNAESSVVGKPGLDVRTAPWDFLSSEMADRVTMYAHGMESRKPRKKHASRRMSAGLSKGTADAVCVVNLPSVMNRQNVLTMSPSR